MLARGGDPLQVGRGGPFQVVVGAEPDAGPHGPLLQEGEPGAEDLAEHRVDAPHAGGRVEPEGVELGERGLVEVQGVRPQRGAAEGQTREPGVALYGLPARSAHGAQRVAPALAAGDGELPVDLIGHQVPEPVLAADVAVEGHGAAYAQLGRQRPHRELAGGLAVGHVHRGAHDAFAAELFGPAGRGGLVEPHQAAGGGAAVGVGGSHGARSLSRVRCPP